MNSAQNLTHLFNQISIARNEIRNLRQQIVSLKHSHKKDVDELKIALEHWRCAHCKNTVSPLEGTSNTADANDTSELPFKIIGHIETTFDSKRAVPRQPGILSESQGIVKLENDVLNNPHHALEGLENFSHMWILFHFHSNENTHVRTKVAPPRLNGIRTGVFATRSPHRPSPIGLSLVKIDRVEGECIYFSGVDMVNGTPVLDIKPYVPQYDTPSVELNNSDTSLISRSLQWERLPRESDGRSEDGDSILQDQSDNDFDIQDRLLIGEASNSSNNQTLESDSGNLPPIRVLDGRDSDDVFSNNTTSLNTNLEENYSDRSPMRLASQREAPEGSEGSSPPSPATGIRIANWISNPPVPRLKVHFSDECTRQIQIICGNTTSAVRMHSTIAAILAEDPRSIYVRNRYSDEPYTCSIERLIVTCFFDDSVNTCLVANVEERNLTETENETEQ